MTVASGALGRQSEVRSWQEELCRDMHEDRELSHQEQRTAGSLVCSPAVVVQRCCCGSTDRLSIRTSGAHRRLAGHGPVQKDHPRHWERTEEARHDADS